MGMAKNKFVQSRIPVPSQRKDSTQQRFQRQSLPPLVPERHDTKTSLLPVLPKRKTSNRYAYNVKTAPLPEAISKGRDNNSAKYRLLLAEKDQKLLETQEYIQVCINSLVQHSVHSPWAVVLTDETYSL